MSSRIRKCSITAQLDLLCCFLTAARANKCVFLFSEPVGRYTTIQDFLNNHVLPKTAQV